MSPVNGLKSTTHGRCASCCTEFCLMAKAKRNHSASPFAIWFHQRVWPEPWRSPSPRVNLSFVIPAPSSSGTRSTFSPKGLCFDPTVVEAVPFRVGLHLPIDRFGHLMQLLLCEGSIFLNIRSRASFETIRERSGRRSVSFSISSSLKSP